MDFCNQVALSTGAASGTGLLFAENFATLGGNVVFCGATDYVQTSDKTAYISGQSF